RSFRNTDPPALADAWNEAFTGRGEIRLRHSSPFENYVFSKPYFDPAGLFLALDDHTVVGFGHAGFGPNTNQSAPSPTEGVICAIGVRPAYRRKGIGSELLRRLEDYLLQKGARTLYAGPMAPFNPFYFGLYGGSETSGFLESDYEAQAFFVHHKYEVFLTRLVFQRLLSLPLTLADSRFAALRKRYDVRIAPQTGPKTWWQEATLG